MSAVTHKRSHSVAFEEPNQRSVRQCRDVLLFIHAETTGLKPTESKTAEVALTILDNRNNGKELGSYKSFVKLSNHDWNRFEANPKAKKANGITRTMGNTGKRAAAIALDINKMIGDLNLTPERLTVVTKNLKFEKPFVEQVWPDSSKYKWQDIGSIFETNLPNIPWLTGNEFAGSSRDDVCKMLRMTKTPTPHSAMSVVKVMVAMYNRMVRPNAPMPYYMMPTYSGLERSRDMTTLWPEEPDADATEKMISGMQRGMVKGCASWMEWNKNGLSGSDAAYAIGASPWWKTPFQLWEEKTGKATTPLSPLEVRGARLEPQARQDFIRATGMNMRPMCVQSPNHDWLRVSLDGISDDGTIILDCICPGEKTYESARGGTLSPHYLYNLQAQMMATGAEHAIAWVWDPVQGGLPIYVKKDAGMQQELKDKMEAFWKGCRENQPPAKIAFDSKENSTAKARKPAPSVAPAAVSSSWWPSWF